MTIYFWVIKVLTTGMGETASDLLARVLGPVPAVALGGLALVASLAVQFTVRRYLPWVYWTAVVMVSVFGTMAADFLHVGLGVPYAVSTPLFLVALAAVFALPRTGPGAGHARLDGRHPVLRRLSGRLPPGRDHRYVHLTAEGRLYRVPTTAPALNLHQLARGVSGCTRSSWAEAFGHPSPRVHHTGCYEAGAGAAPSSAAALVTSVPTA